MQVFAPSRAAWEALVIKWPGMEIKGSAYLLAQQQSST